MKLHKRTAVFAAALAASTALMSAASLASGGDAIRIVGSSTVYPFATVVAERFGRTTRFPTPVIESTGTGGGFKLFCAGQGKSTPDVTNASRAIKPSEVNNCKANNTGPVIEVKIGYDGIVLANSVNGPEFDLTLQDIFLALAKQVPGPSGGFIPNPNRTWRNVNSSLPDIRIEVLGPPPTSGTRDAFNELAMEGGCNTIPAIKELEKTDKAKHKQICYTLREDGAYIDAGENDNFIVSKLTANENALGVFGFSFLDQNLHKVKGAPVNGVEPTFESIADGSYAISRPLYFYFKQAHVGVTPGLREYVAEFISDAATGEFGYLTDRGLIPLDGAERARVVRKVKGALEK